MIAAAQNAAAQYLGHHIALNAALMGGMRVFNVALGFVTTVLIVRGIGVYAFGLFAFAVSIAAMGSVVMRLGLPLLIVREGTAAAAMRDWDAYHAVMRFSARTGIILVTGTAAIMLIVFSGPTPLARTEYAFPGVVGAIGASLMTLNALLQARLRGAMEITRAYASELLIMQGTMLLIILALLTSQRLTLENACAAFLASWTIAAVTSFYWWRRHKPDVPPAQKPPILWRKLSRTTLSLFFLGLTMLLIGKVETLFLAVFAGPDAVGNFVFAFRVASVTSIAGFAVSSLFSPRLANLKSGDNNTLLLKEIRVVTIVNVAASFFIAASVSLVGWFAFPIIVPELTSVRYLTPILSFGFVIASFAGRSFDMAAMMGSGKGAMIAAAIMLPFFIALLLILTPVHGVFGAAIATAIATAIDAILLGVIVYRETGLRTDIASIGATKHAR